jgi:hypothetical protein
MVSEQGSSLHYVTAVSRRCGGDRKRSSREVVHRRGGLQQVVAALALLTMPARAADRVDLRFEIFGFAGLHLLTSRTSAEVTPRTYAIAANLSTRGIVSAFVDLRSHSEVYGTLASQSARPDDYRAEVRRNGTERDYEVKYLANGDVINTKTPPRRRSIDIDPAQLRGTVDQLTAYFLVERQLARTGSCSAIVPVYDGSELYRMRFIDVRSETLTADGGQNFAGATRLCEIVRDVIVANPDTEESTYDRGRLWYARLLSDGRMFPVRMEYDTPFGQVHGYLGALDGPDVHLNFDGK